MYKLIVIAAVMAMASAGYLSGPAVHVAPAAPVHVAAVHAAPAATSYANTHHIVSHTVPIKVPVPVAVHAAPVAVHAAPAYGHAYHG